MGSASKDLPFTARPLTGPICVSPTCSYHNARTYFATTIPNRTDSMTRNFPQELVDSIIAQGNGEVSLLRACALVSKDWLAPSRSQLFHTVRLDEDNMQSWMRLIHKPNSLPDIVPFVKRVYFNFQQYTPKDRGCWEFPNLAPYLDHLKLDVLSIAYGILADPSLVLPSGLVVVELRLHVIARTLKCLANFISSCPSVKRLVVETVEGWSKEEEEVVQSQILLPSLTSLRLNVTRSISQSFLRILTESEEERAIKDVAFTDIDAGCLGEIGGYIARHGQQLTTLQLDFCRYNRLPQPLWMIDEVTNTLDPAKLTSLSILILHMDIKMVHHWLVAALKPLVKLDLQCLILFIEDYAHNFIPEDGDLTKSQCTTWAGIDSIFSSPTSFKSLKELVILHDFEIDGQEIRRSLSACDGRGILSVKETEVLDGDPLFLRHARIDLSTRYFDGKKIEG